MATSRHELASKICLAILPLHSLVKKVFAEDSLENCVGERQFKGSSGLRGSKKPLAPTVPCVTVGHKLY